MTSKPGPTATAFQLTMDLFEAGVDIMRHNLSRQHPDETAAQVERRLAQWLRDRPGAKFGDCSGRAVDPASRRL
jgi:hypothetical protein